MKRTLALLLALFPLACGSGLGSQTQSTDAGIDSELAVDTEAFVDGGLLSCGPGPITIAEDCMILTNWKCQVPTELWRTPCVIPNLHCLLVTNCDMCIINEQMAGVPTP